MQTAPAYRNAWRRSQRCLIPALGFYEWQAIPGQKQKQPYYIQITDPDYLVGDNQFAFAGLWESSRRDDGEIVESFTIITMPANELMAEIHNPKKRMPFILSKTAYQNWLAGSAEQQACRYLVIDFGTSKSPKSTRLRDSHWAPTALRPCRFATPSQARRWLRSTPSNGLTACRM